MDWFEVSLRCTIAWSEAALRASTAAADMISTVARDAMVVWSQPTVPDPVRTPDGALVPLGRTRHEPSSWYLPSTHHSARLSEWAPSPLRGGSIFSPGFAYSQPMTAFAPWLDWLGVRSSNYDARWPFSALAPFGGAAMPVNPAALLALMFSGFPPFPHAAMLPWSAIPSAWFDAKAPWFPAPWLRTALPLPWPFSPAASRQPRMNLTLVAYRSSSGFAVAPIVAPEACAGALAFMLALSPHLAKIGTSVPMWVG